MTSDQSAEGLFSTAPPSEPGEPVRPRVGAKALVGRVAGSVVSPLIRRFAKDFVGGETLDEAWSVAERLAASGTPNTLGFWDDQTYSTAEVAAIYRDTIARLGRSQVNGYVSIKPPALRYDPVVAKELAITAEALGVRIHADSHGENAAEATWGFIDEMRRHLRPTLISVSVPGRWPRSINDVRRAASAGIGVRVVKGQWPAEQGDRPLADGFVAVVDEAAGRAAPLAIATHDADVIRRCLPILRDRSVGCEQEFIMGVPANATVQLARDGGLPVRIYIPYGRGFIPNALGTLRRNPALGLQVARRIVSFGRR